MNDHFDLDKEIKNRVSRNEEIPESVKTKTRLAYKEIRAMHKYNKKAGKKKWIVVAGILVATGITLQTPLLADIKALFFEGNYKGVESAIDKGHLQSVEGAVSESNGITIEVTEALIDPTIIHLRLILRAEDPKLLQKFKYDQHTIQFVDQFNITDDQGRVIQEIHDEGVYAPSHINEQGKEVRLLSSSTEQVSTNKLNEGEIQIDMILNSSEGNYKDIKGLILQSNQLNNFSGSWVLNVTFPSEMTETQETTYEVSKPNSQIELTSAIAMKTGVKIDCIIKVPVDENVVNGKIVGEDGTVFTTGRAGWMESTSKGERVVLTFEALEEELGDRFTLYIPTRDGEESITLTKVLQ